MAATHLEKSKLDMIYNGFKIQFKDGMLTATAFFKQLATIITSSTTIENYPIFDQFPRMREWIGPRKIEQIKLRMLAVKNRNFESTVKVKRQAIADDQMGIYGNLITGLGTAASNIWDDLLFEILCANEKWLDDKPFYGTTRSYVDSQGKNSPKIVNLTDQPLNHDTFTLGYDTMLAYVGHGGTPLNVVPRKLVVGPHYRTMAEAIVNGDKVKVDGEWIPNPNKGKVEIILSTRLVGEYAKKWFLMDDSQAIKPVILQQRAMPTLTRLDTEQCEPVFMNDENLYGTAARGEATKVIPHLLYMGNPA